METKAPPETIAPREGGDAPPADAPGSVTIHAPTSSASGSGGKRIFPTMFYGSRRLIPLKDEPAPEPVASDPPSSHVAPGSPTVIVAGAGDSSDGASARGRSPTVVVIRGSSASAGPAATADAAPPVPAPVTPAPTAPIPFRVGAYEVATRIARGGMGSIYVCRKVSEPNRLLTLKVVRQHGRQDLAATSFRHEALIGSLFRHAHAQTVVDAGLYEGQPFLVLDHVEGASLAEMLGEETRPTPAIVVAIVLDVLAALQALHRVTDPSGNPLGIIHCDVSPENIIVGIDGVARLADFGSARITAVSNETQPFAVSKPPYMPPEQFRGEQLDARSDIYSTGVLLWTALAGQQPFKAESYDQTAVNVLRRKVKPPSAHGAPACLDDVCMQALSRSVESRFVVADAMAAALRTAAMAGNLGVSREEVGAWVRRAVGDELGQQRRRIDAVFASGPSRAAAASYEPPSPTTNSAARSPAAATPPLGEKTLSSRTLFVPGPERFSKLTRRQRGIVLISSVVAFLVTVAIGALTLPSGKAPRGGAVAGAPISAGGR